MSYNFYVSEIEWSYREAELARKLERKRQLEEARAARLARKMNPELAETTYLETTNTKKIGKETLGWN
jgi:tRNA A-37 threonylcarbamoyl transferase component Bud32